MYKQVILTFSLIFLSFFIRSADQTAKFEKALTEFNMELAREVLAAGISIEQAQSAWYAHLTKGFKTQLKPLKNPQMWNAQDAQVVLTVLEHYKNFLILLQEFGVSFEYAKAGELSFQDSWNLQYPFLRDMISEYEATALQGLQEADKCIAKELIGLAKEMHEIVNK